MQDHLSILDLIDRRFEIVKDAVISLERDRKANARIKVGIADERDRQVELHDVHCIFSQTLMVRPACREGLSALDILLDLETVPSALVAHAHATASHRFQIFHDKGHFGSLAGLRDSFTAHDELCLSTAVTAQGTNERLSLGAHNLTHRCLCLAKVVGFALTIVIDDFKLKVLLLLKVVCEGE